MFTREAIAVIHSELKEVMEDMCEEIRLTCEPLDDEIQRIEYCLNADIQEDAYVPFSERSRITAEKLQRQLFLQNLMSVQKSTEELLDKYHAEVIVDNEPDAASIFD